MKRARRAFNGIFLMGWNEWKCEGVFKTNLIYFWVGFWGKNSDFLLNDQAQATPGIPNFNPQNQPPQKRKKIKKGISISLLIFN